mgnify:FL=1|tara:strand:- start:77037 stop:77552 length:516 start_codon:yes stop_codon:yes gene_type:complete
MKILYRISVLVFIVSLASCAQETTFSEDVMSYIKNNGTSKQYEYAYDELLSMLENQYPKTEENSKGWDYMNSSKEKYVTEILTLLAPVYEKNFTHEEIKKMNVFYNSEAGKQLVTGSAQMTENQKKEVNDFYATTVGKKIMEKQPILASEISKVSEGWSRDLYETALSMLK